MSNAKEGQHQQFGKRTIGRPGRQAPEGTLYVKFPKTVEMSRFLQAEDFDDRIIDSLRRELQRAAGIRADEPASELANGS
jgi:hypothetical protein